MLIETRYEDNGEPMNDRQLLDEAIILFTAGHETTANALAWTMYLLSQNPDVLDKLKEEIDSFDQIEPDLESVRQLSYTLQVASEALRLYPPAWILDRVALENDTVKDVQISKGDMIGLFVYGTHHNTDIWDDPEVFRPERFSNENKQKVSAYAYYPFGGGPRLCIGHQFAILEMQLALLHLIRRFDFDLVPDQQIDIQPLITLRPRYGIKMNLYPRDPKLLM